MKKKRTSKSKTLLTVFGAPEFSPRGRKAIAKWLRARAEDIEQHAG